ncbi:hypothetical protein [uncultured Eubacterium sp.]|uniref:hypothetical protein n=1 Tax=uncultured Eubacterium sp. TaxID=165185 RepID=UPI0026725A3D|nr:hypothetical protein [uncultured Eubacterium sp.]
MKKIFKTGIVLGLIFSLSIPVSASSLATKVTSTKKSITVGKYTEIKGAIEYNGCIYKGFYKLELPNTIIDDTVLSSSFGVNKTTFVYSKGRLSGKNYWCFNTSFFSWTSTTKTVKVKCMGASKGEKKVYCGTGKKGDHDLDDSASVNVKVK